MPKFFGRPSDSIEVDPENDPLTRAMAPPENETRAEYDARIAAQEEAKKRSDAIDEEINRQRLELKRQPNCVRVMLLGQSESGKSTTLKNFQLLQSDKAFRHERASWRAVIQLNVVRSVRLILDAITEAHANINGTGSSPPPTSMGLQSWPRTESVDSHSISQFHISRLSPELLKLRMRLLPLQQVEEVLLRKLTPAGSAEFEATHLSPVTHTPYRGGRDRGPRLKEVTINSTSHWKAAFGKLMANARASIESAADIDFEDPNDPGVILNACAEDINQLWNDPTVRLLLDAYKIRLENMGGFFLDSINRVTALRYVPTDDDILRARLKTLGVSEHRFSLKSGGNVLSHDWRVYDVGGARSLRAAWAPYFDNLNGIIFLAPISGFDEVLLEDASVNKLEDSILLWKYIVGLKILANTQIVLFLNKVDLFKAKIKSGVQLAEYVVSYGARPNDFESTSSYIRKKFALILKQHSLAQRTFYCHLTAMTDSKSTEKILYNVRDMVLREMLESSNLL